MTDEGLNEEDIIGEVCEGDHYLWLEEERLNNMEEFNKEIEEKISKLDNAICLLGMNGLAYTDIWNDKIKERERLKNSAKLSIIGNFKNPLVSREQLNFMEDIILKGGIKK